MAKIRSMSARIGDSATSSIDIALPERRLGLSASAGEDGRVGGPPNRPHPHPAADLRDLGRSGLRGGAPNRSERKEELASDGCPAPEELRHMAPSRVALLSVLVALLILVPLAAANTGAGHPLPAPAARPTTGTSIPSGSRGGPRVASRVTPPGANVSGVGPSVLETISLCNATVLRGQENTICAPNAPTAVDYDPVSHLVFLTNYQICFGCTDYVVAYNDTTDQVAWTYITGTVLSGQTPMAMTVDPTDGTLFVANL